MPLSAKLLKAVLTRHCPHCDHKIEKPGHWFQSVYRYRCDGCGQLLKLSYPDKLKLFAAYGGEGAN